MAVLFVLGFGAGWLALPANPLKTQVAVRDREEIPKKDTVKKQVFHAFQAGGTETAWKAVIDNFPENTYYQDVAQRRLALHLSR